MTINELMYMFVDEDSQRICIYDLDTDDVIYYGLYCDIPFYLKQYSITNIDNLTNDDTLTIIVDSLIQ